MPGDEIYSIDGHRTYFSSNVTLYLSRSSTQVYDVVVLRDGEKLEFSSVSIEPYENGDGSWSTASASAPLRAPSGPLSSIPGTRP